MSLSYIIATLKHNDVFCALIIIIVLGRASQCTNMEGEGEEYKSQILLYSFTSYVRINGIFRLGLLLFTHTHTQTLAYTGIVPPTTSHGIKGNGI